MTMETSQTSTTASGAPSAGAASGATGGATLAFVYVTALFFGWGFVTALIDPLVPAVKSIFKLSFLESQLTQFAWFIAYGLASLPAAAILSRLGFANAILAALATMIVGCLLVPLGTHGHAYVGVLAGLFVIASGVTLLQVAANPLVAALGRPDSAHFRLTFSQAFNSVGTVVGPLFGAAVLLTGGIFAKDEAVRAEAVASDAALQESLRNIDFAFLSVAAIFALLAVFIFSVRKKVNEVAPSRESIASSPLQALSSGWAIAGAVAIFLYVGAEVTIGSFMINYLHQDGIMGISLERAGQLLAFYWGGAMVGRFIGSALMTRLPAAGMLTVAAAIAAALCLVVTQLGGPTAGWLAISIGLFNAIMFPTIFTLTLERSSAPAAATSGLLCMAIIGGAFLPLIAGQIADATTLSTAFFVPMLGYAGIAVFAFFAMRAAVRTTDVAAVGAGH
jgi:MFS transporter, FHS family, L-fucose permease